MTPRRRAFLILALALALIAVIVAVILMLARATSDEPPAALVDQAPADVEQPLPAPEPFQNPLISAPEEEAGTTAGVQVAELFAERFGSYSNQGDYRNLRDLLPVMTARYRQETEAFLRTADPAPGASYEGVTSVKISTEVRSADDDSAIIAVALQQERSTGTTVTTGYRTLRMELQLVGGAWKVDRASWEG